MQQSIQEIVSLLDNYYFKIAIIDKKMKYEWIQFSPSIQSININTDLLTANFSTSLSNILIQEHIERILHEYINSQLLVFYNFEILFRQEYRFDLMSFLKEKSKKQKYAMIWPGQIKQDELIYSRPDRSDYYTHKIDNYLIVKGVL